MLSVNRDRGSIVDANVNSNSNAADSILSHQQRINQNSHQSHSDGDDDEGDNDVNVDVDVDGGSDMCVWAHDLKRKQGKTLILKGISLALPKGKIYGLLGPSGCG